MASYTKDFLMKMLENLWMVRKFEESAMDASLKGEIKGNVHVCLGQEGEVVGANMALEPTDFITASHRGHGHCVMKCGDVDHAMAELYGKEEGLCHGRGGSMHVTKIESGLLGANGIVGGGIALATGSALASQTNGDGHVTISFFGDGASNQGVFHESINMAAAWKLPIIYFVENNGFAVSTKIGSVTNTPDLAKRAAAYGIPGAVIDGTDVLAVYEATRQAVEAARRGEGPTLLDCHVYKFTGHFVGDPAKYINPDYTQEAHEQDAIKKFKAYLLANQVATDEEMDALEKTVADRIEKARQFAAAGTEPDKTRVLDYNYACDNERCVIR